ncbi:3'(2'),5'-bisphosphate nucleotidase [Trifolium repens]|nr:3'(2'),5'-bisphosphate nucleotidase [Trifolium repens]
MPWNSLMDKMMMELHSNGITIEEIEKVLHRIPIHHRIIPAIKSAHALGCDLRIVSDANMFFIETILKHLGISECFSEINTNPGYVNQEGRLRILPYHDFNKASHGCPICPPNMCKAAYKRLLITVEIHNGSNVLQRTEYPSAEESGLIISHKLKASYECGYFLMIHMLNIVSATLVGSWTQIFGDSKPFQTDEVKNVQECCANMILEHIEASKIAARIRHHYFTSVAPISTPPLYGIGQQ